MSGSVDALAGAHESVIAMLAAAAADAPHSEALVFGERRLDYAGYVACVAGFARELESIGARGERVATLIGNSIDACIAMFGALAAGAQLVPLNPLLTAHELEPILLDAAPRVLVVDAALRRHVHAAASAAGIAHIIEIGFGGRSLDALRDRETALPRLLQPDALALLQYTGGTTGRAKGVELTHRAIALNVEQREALLPTRRGDRIVCMMPLSHAYGMAMGLFLAAHCAGTLVILARYQPEEVLAVVARERINVFPGSPTVFVGLLSHPAFAATDWRSVHTCYSGASALAAATLARWQEAVGAPVFEGYGLTEAGPVLSFNPARGAVKAGSVGVAVPDTQIEIVDVQTGTQVLAAGEVGEVRARGPQLMRGYRGLPDETAHALRDGWLYTGDIGEFDADGYLFIRDRKKDMVIVGGYNVYPREVEEVLFAHADVADAAVVGEPDAYRGERLVAHVVLRPGAARDAEALLAYCRERLAKYKIPQGVHYADALPKTPANKTDKIALRSLSTASGAP